MAEKGIVSVVGAGPAIPGLLTLRGSELLATADAVVYERRSQRKLIPGGTSGGPERFYVGARRDVARARPADVAQLLVGLARRELRVVYLAHGDPLAFGRDTELVTALNDASVRFEIVPGVSTGSAVSSYGGIPLLAPTMSAAAIFVDGRRRMRGTTETDWTTIAKVGATVVVRNASTVLPSIVTGFALAGVSGEIPAAAVVHPGRQSQRTVVATIGTIADAMTRAGMTGAATLVIGWTVLLRDELAWFETRPLSGKLIVFAQSRFGLATVADRLRDLGAAVIDAPPPAVARLDLSALRAEIERIAAYEWLVFASPDAVSIFWEQLILSGRDTRVLSNARIACVEPATAAALLDRGVTVDVVQEKFDRTALIDTLTERPDIPGAAMLCLADDASAEPLARDLEQAGATVTSLALYRDVIADRATQGFRRKLESRHPAIVVAMSPAAAESYVHAAGEHAAQAPAAAYDPATASALTDAGVEVVVEPGRPGADTLIDAIVSRLGSGAPS